MRIKRTTEITGNSSTLLKELQVGDKIQIAKAWWKVLELKDDKALIWKCTNIKNHVFNENNSNVYEGSDIQKYLQTDFKDEFHSHSLLDIITDGGFFLLTVDEILQYMPNEIDRIATDKDGYTTWYWTASPSVGRGSSVRLINPAGYVNYYNAFNSYGVSPACWINL